MIDWLFRNRQTGRITIGQVPNAPLIVFLVATGVRWLFHPTGTVGAVVSVTATLGLVVWAGDELLRGVNPWRRILGGTVLASTVVLAVLR